MNIFFRLNRLFQIRRAFGQGKTLLAYLPSRVWIELTDNCNLRCPLCPNQALPKEEKGFMPRELFKKIIDQISGEVFDLNLFHRGEPLLHPHLIEMIEYAHRKGIPCRIHTNATLLSESLSERILDSG
ncbi:MAG: radical SAM protein, partial [Desulfobacca sp.]|nr:radical SAM protein [Desulfobacca sp.]